MMDWTDRHCRYFLRLISRHAYLYTEMVTTGAILHGDRDHLLAFDPSEQPLGLQLGGSDPHDLAQCARIGEDYGYDEINLNVGCPSDRVRTGRFGACLMAEPQLVADCVAAMSSAVKLPVSIKTRIGIDEHDSYEFLYSLVNAVAAAGCSTVIIHARKAWLQGLSPKENREVPPLNYEAAYRVKRDFPRLEIIVNGGITDLEQAQTHLQHVDGVMLGRIAYHHPYLLAAVDQRLYNDSHPAHSREQVIEALIPYTQKMLASGGRLHHITRHILGLFQGVPGARAWRRYLSENSHAVDAGAEVLKEALKQISTRAPISAPHRAMPSKSLT